MDRDAYRNPIRVFEIDDLTMLIGAAADSTLLEIGVVVGEASSSSFMQCLLERST